MSMYHMMNGVNPATFFILPMLGEKHSDEYPRFRDCFVSIERSKDKTIVKREITVLTRTGGGNRTEYAESIRELRKHTNYVKDFDHEDDNTYAVFVFTVPEEWIPDYDLIISGKVKEIGKTYQERLYKVFPKLKDKFDSIFK